MIEWVRTQVISDQVTLSGGRPGLTPLALLQYLPVPVKLSLPAQRAKIGTIPTDEAPTAQA